VEKVLATRGLVLKHFDEAELRIVSAAVLAALAYKPVFRLKRPLFRPKKIA
jgi:hypothetical protein